MKNSILWMSDSRESAPVALRCMQEGINTYFFCHDVNYRDNFQGIMPMIGPGGLKAALNKTDTVIFDITLAMSSQDKPASFSRDMSLLGMFGIKANSKSGVFGRIGDKLSETHQVIGTSSWTEHIELDRVAGIELAKRIGLGIPEYKEFNSLKAGVKFLQGNKNKWVFKPLGNKDLDLTYADTYKGELLDMLQYNLPDRFQKDNVSYILQKFIDGTEVSSELWWDGEKFCHPNRTLEDKKLGSGNTGPATGSQSNSVWMCEDMEGPVHKEMQKLAPYLRLSNYLGCIDANCIISDDGKPWFLEWTPRFGWSALYCLLSFLPEGQLSTFFLNGFNAVFREGFVTSQLVSLYPYPNVDKKQLDTWTKGNLINHSLSLPGMWWQDVYLDDEGKLRVCGSDGIVGVYTNLADTLEDSITGLHKRLKKLQISGNVQYRTENDHLTRHMERYKRLEKADAV